MASQLIQELIDAGVHYGHRTSRWNPKMKPYIYGKRNSLHIIDVKETLRGLLLAKKFIVQTVSKGKDVLFIGTKRQARKSVQKHAERAGMHYVNDRWLGGTLTNFREIRKRMGRLDQLEHMEAEGLLDAYSKKEGSSLRREMRKIRRNLGGIRKMEKHPGVLVVVDVQRETIAIREARKMNIPVVCLIDTDGDPDLVDIPIPGNDDAMRAIELILQELADAVEIGAQTRVELSEEPARPAPPRRSRRATTARAQDDEPADEAETEKADGESTDAPASASPADATPEPEPAAEDNA
jgi:small subunit ribosomal protein S2